MNGLESSLAQEFIYTLFIESNMNKVIPYFKKWGWEGGGTKYYSLTLRCVKTSAL